MDSMVNVNLFEAGILLRQRMMGVHSGFGRGKVHRSQLSRHAAPTEAAGGYGLGGVRRQFCGSTVWSRWSWGQDVVMPPAKETRTRSTLSFVDDAVSCSGWTLATWPMGPIMPCTRTQVPVLSSRAATMPVLRAAEAGTSQVVIRNQHP